MKNLKYILEKSKILKIEKPRNWNRKLETSKDREIEIGRNRKIQNWNIYLKKKINGKIEKLKKIDKPRYEKQKIPKIEKLEYTLKRLKSGDRSITKHKSKNGEF